MMERLPAWAQTFLHWLLTPHVLVVLSIASVVMFVLSLVGVPWFFARVPADYFTRHERGDLGMTAVREPGWRMALRVVKNILGAVVFVAGVAMLVLPGQGLLTILASLFLLDFPGKRRLQRRIVASKPVFRTLNRLRQRAGRAPLERGSIG
jgi:hypothetical protein